MKRFDLSEHEVVKVISHPKCDTLSVKIYRSISEDIYFFDWDGDWDGDLELIEKWAMEHLQYHYSGAYASDVSEALATDRQEREAGC